MSKFLRVFAVVSALAVVGAILAQNRANSQTQTNGQRAKATASSSSSSSHNGGAISIGGGIVGPWRDPTKEVYVILYEPGPTWKKGKTYYEQPLSSHAKFLAELQKRNILLLAGPFKDNSGEEVVVQVNNEAEVMDIVAADPAIIMKVMTAVYKPWHLTFENTGRNTFGGNNTYSRGTGGGPTATSGSRSGGG